MILVTGALDDFDEQSRTLGARLLVKPVAVDALCTAVREALEPTRLSSTDVEPGPVVQVETRSTARIASHAPSAR